MNNNEEIISAVTEIEKNSRKIEGERGSFSFGSKRRQLPAGGKAFLISVLFCGIAIASISIWKASKMAKTTSKVSTNTDIVRNTLPALNPLPPKVLSTSDSTLPVEPEPQNSEAINVHNSSLNNSPNRVQSNLLETNRTRKLSPMLKNNTADTSSQQTSNNTNQSTNNSELQNKLQPLSLNSSVAGKLPSPDYLLTQGSIIDCQLETRMITTQPGMTSCYVTRNIYSSNGKVVLVDRGSKVVGNYQGGIQQGQARIFVLWSRIETPKGVVINLDSPGSGPLGEGGVGGKIDNHFFLRFGGSIMTSIIDDIGQYIVNSPSKGEGKDQSTDKTITIKLDNTIESMQEAAKEVSESSTDMQPILYKNHGERISIFVARDLDFKSVYGLKSH